MRNTITIQGSGPDGILHYYKCIFDPITKKYNIDSIAKKLKSQNKVINIYDAEIKPTDPIDLIKTDIYNALYRYEQNNDLSDLTKKDYTHIIENLYSIYHSSHEEIENQVELIDIVSRRVIGEYIGINGLERLFSEQYIDFEWEMHLGMNHKTSQMSFYRDHFIHQVRDAFTIDKLLEQKVIYDAVYSTLCNPNSSKVSRYFCQMVQKQQDMLKNLPTHDFLKLDEDFVPRNVIYLSCYMAGLFHDIGYPETYLRNLRERISEYMPNMHPGQYRELPNGIFSTLQNSLLFRVVPCDEIKNRVSVSSIDHGTLSALAFLLHFYENGAIFQMPPYKAAAVELAALAIYNHTNKYDICGSKNSIDYRPVFTTNPISYLLRICDDLQEWDRVYFEISTRSNILICNKCMTPVVGRKELDNTIGNEISEREYEQTPKPIRHRYICNCCDENNPQTDIFCRVFDGNSAFPYRRMYNVQVCDRLDIVSDDSHTSDIIIHLHYDPYRLLNIAFISPEYAKFRIDELNKLKPLLMQQSLPKIWLDYFVTANPILIKTKIVGDYIESNIAPKDQKNDNLEAQYNKLQNLFCEQVDKYLKNVRPEEKRSRIKREIFDSVLLYVSLYLFYKLPKKEKDINNCVSIFNYIYSAKVKRECKKSTAFRHLLGDAILQLKRCWNYSDMYNEEAFPDDYLHQFEIGNWQNILGVDQDINMVPNINYFKTALRQYTDETKYTPVLMRDEDAPQFDAFTDLGLIKYLYQHTSTENSCRDVETV